MIINQISVSDNYPITISDVENQIRLPDLSLESDAINMFIAAITSQAESITRRALMPQQWELVLDEFPCDKIELPFPPLQSVDEITYIDDTGIEQTLDPSLYKIVASNSEKCQPGYVIPTYNNNWPVTLDDVAVIKIKFTCGYVLPVYPNFDGTKAYLINQKVLYSDNNSYIALSNVNTGVLPTDITKWDLIPLSEAVPKRIRQWMLINVCNLYENRETISVGTRLTQVDVTTISDGLIDDFRVPRL